MPSREGYTPLRLFGKALPVYGKVASCTWQDLLLCVRKQPHSFHLDFSTYLADRPGPNLYVHRICQDDGSCIIPHDVGPMASTHGRLRKSSVRPLGRCRAGRITVPCPRRPVDTLRTFLGYNFSKHCLALPDVSGNVVRALPIGYVTSSRSLLCHEIHVFARH